MHLLFIVSLIYVIVQLFKEAFEKPIPAENWANKAMYHQDIMNGVPVEQRMKWVKEGRYKITEKYPEPHRDPQTGKIIIENDELYWEDVRKHGAYQAQQWVNQGKYNLTPEELKKKHEEYEKKMERMYELARSQPMGRR